MVIVGKKTKKSGRALAQALERNDIVINWGNARPRVGRAFINKPEAVRLASNKKKALYTMQEADVPVPRLFNLEEAINYLVYEGDTVVARTSYHSKGRGMWTCTLVDELVQARDSGATHFMEYVENAREFRVHVVGGNSIKISEKIGSGNHATGAIFEYPHEFMRKRELRRIAKEAVECLGLDFGAVDLMVTGYKDPDVETQFYVLEVNTAPCLTDENSDTLECYVRAFETIEF